MGLKAEEVYAILKKQIQSVGGAGGMTNYNDLFNKPKINSVELTGDKALPELGIPEIHFIDNQKGNTPLILSELEVGTYVFYYGTFQLKGFSDSTEIRTCDCVDNCLYVYRKWNESFTKWDAVACYLDDGLNVNQLRVDESDASGSGIAGANLAFGGCFAKTLYQEQITGLWKFNTLPQSEVVPTDDKELANKKYVDDSHLEKAIEIYYNLRRTGKVYQTKLWKFASNPTSTGEKLLDNAGLMFEPSTDTEEGQSDYLNGQHPLFEWVYVNYIRDSDGTARPTAIEGMESFQESGSVDVGAMQMSFWFRWDASNPEYDLITISDLPHPELGLEPWVECVKADGTVLPWCIGDAYFSGVAADGLLRSQLNLKPARTQSHNNMITNYQQKGDGYWGAGSCHNAFQIIFNAIKGNTKNSQTLYAGCTSYNYQYEAAIQSADAHTYFPVTNAQAANLVVGSFVSIGYGSNNNGAVNQDRGQASVHAYADDVKILSIETLDDDNMAVFLDIPEEDAFTTVPHVHTEELSAPIILSTMHWWSGATNSVKGRNDGSPGSNTNGKYPYRVQGREYAVGGYTVASDTVIDLQADYTKKVLVAPKGVAHSSADATIRSTYTEIGIMPAAAAGNNADWWIGDFKLDMDTGAWYPAAEGSGSSQGTGDRNYSGGSGATGGTREYLQGGHLWLGSDAGSSCLNCRNWLGFAGWHYLSRD